MYVCVDIQHSNDRFLYSKKLHKCKIRCNMYYSVQITKCVFFAWCILF